MLVPGTSRFDLLYDSSSPSLLPVRPLPCPVLPSCPLPLVPFLASLPAPESSPVEPSTSESRTPPLTYPHERDHSLS